MAVTRVINIINDIKAGTNTFNVNGYLSAMLRINVSGVTGTRAIGIYASPNDAVSTSSERPDVYYNGVIYKANIILNADTKTDVLIDLKGIKTLLVYVVDTNFVATGGVSLSTFTLQIEKMLNKENSFPRLFLAGAYYNIETLGAKQIDFKVETTGGIVGAGKNINFQGLNSANQWEDITFIEKNTRKVIVGGQANLVDNGGIIEGFANIEDYKEVRITSNMGNNILRTAYDLHNDYVDRVIPVTMVKGDIGWGYGRNPFFRGYKYFKLKFRKSTLKNGSGTIKFTAKDKEGNIVETEKLNARAERLNSVYGKENALQYVYGNIIGGGVCFHAPTGVDAGTVIITESTNDTESFELNIDMHMTVEKPEYKPLNIYKDAQDYTIYELESPATTKDAYVSDVIEYSNNRILFYMYGYDGIVYEIPFDKNSVPSLLDGETIKMAYVMPMQSRNGATGTDYYMSRIVVFTNKARVLHNFPVGRSNRTDMSLFDESTVINPLKKWLPINDKSKVSKVLRYFPVLKDYNYNQFDGRIGVDYFGNGGLQQGTEIGTLLMDFQTTTAGYGRLSYANMARDAKLSLFANYNGSVGEEPFVMSTNDAGRTWRVVMNFACVDMYNNNVRGGDIDLTAISNVTSYQADMLKVYRKEFNVASEVEKEPNTPFIISDEFGEVKRFYVENGTTMIELSNPFHIGGVTPVVFFKKNVENIGDWEHICNNDMNATGENNNGVFFRLERVNNTTYKMYADYGDPYQSDIICRHVHAVNKTNSGYVVSTGESYAKSRNNGQNIFSGGFIYYIAQNSRNGSNTIASDIIKQSDIYRLTSSPLGVNRACGAYMLDKESDPTIIYVSDEGGLEALKRNAKIEGRTIEIPLTPYGIYKGKLSDIDNQDKYECVCPFPRTIISLVEHYGNFACDGHSAELILSKGGKSWNIEMLIRGYINGTDNNGNIYYGNKLIRFK